MSREKARLLSLFFWVQAIEELEKCISYRWPKVWPATLSGADLAAASAGSSAINPSSIDGDDTLSALMKPRKVDERVGGKLIKPPTYARLRQQYAAAGLAERNPTLRSLTFYQSARIALFYLPLWRMYD